LLIALSICSAEATVKNQGHGTLNLDGEIVETPSGIAGESLDQSVDFGLISMSDAALDAQPALIGSRRIFEIKLVNCELASQVKPNFIYRVALSPSTARLTAGIPSYWVFMTKRKAWPLSYYRYQSPDPAGQHYGGLPGRRRQQYAALWRSTTYSPCLITPG
jgi:hypothetical protein